MSESEIIDYGRQKAVNNIFAFFLVAAIAVAVFLFIQDMSFENFIILFALVPFALGLASLGFGAASKRAIDYVPGKWKKEKTWVDLAQYQTMKEKYDEAYGHLTKKDNACCSCVCGIFLIPALIIAFLIPFGFSVPPPIYSVIFIAILYTIPSALGFWAGYGSVGIDPHQFFEELDTGSLDKYLAELSTVPGVRAGYSVTLGLRAGIRTIIEAESRIHVEGLPETVALQVQVSESGFVYPYVVGTVYKGGTVSEGEEIYRIGTRYPALIEYSMDGDVAVIVGRFDIPERTSSVPRISQRDFRRLAELVIQKVKDIHESGQ